MKIKQFFQVLWYKKTFSTKDYLFFSVLWLCSFLYRFGFRVVIGLKKIKGQQRCPWFNVLAIGNLAVGGTGKTVFAQFLISLLRDKKGGVILRGYRGTKSSRATAFLVSDGKQLFSEVDQCGDEAFMLACDSKVPVAISKDRYLACKVLAENCNLDFVILDDAYQNVDICKDVEILLVDARYPLSNTYCLPAGFLREKDYSRADIIVLTHAKSLSKEQKNEWSDFFSTINPQHLFFGDNKWEGLFLCNQGDDKTQVVQRERVLLFAGIGNISGFVENANEFMSTNGNNSNDSSSSHSRGYYDTKDGGHYCGSWDSYHYDTRHSGYY